MFVSKSQLNTQFRRSRTYFCVRVEVGHGIYIDNNLSLQSLIIRFIQQQKMGKK